MDGRAERCGDAFFLINTIGASSLTLKVWPFAFMHRRDGIIRITYYIRKLYSLQNLVNAYAITVII